jgi:protein ImuB
VAELHDLSEYPSCRDLEPLLFVLKNLADRAMARLHGRAQRMASLEMVLDLEKGKREWKLELPVPQGSVAGLLPILRERLSFDLQRKPLEHAIVRISITVVETAPAHRSQRDLFQASDQEAEAWDALVGRLCQKLGKDRAFIAQTVDAHLPERAWARALEALDRLPLDIPQRPIRVLRNPQPLKQEGHFLVQQAQAPSKRWLITEWQGPERIAVEWWMDPQLEGFKRDYYKVMTENGEKLWIFTVPARQGYYLHGYFD